MHDGTHESSLLSLLTSHMHDMLRRTLECARAHGMGGSRHCASSSVVCAALERAEQLAMDAEAAEFESALSAPDERPELAQVQAKLAASELAAELAAQAAAAISTDSNAGERAPTASPACSAITELRRPTVAGAPTVTPAVAPTAGTSAPAVRAPAARAPAATETPTNAARSEPADVQAASALSALAAELAVPMGPRPARANVPTAPLIRPTDALAPASARSLHASRKRTREQSDGAECEETASDAGSVRSLRSVSQSPGGGSHVRFG